MAAKLVDGFNVPDIQHLDNNLLSLNTSYRGPAPVTPPPNPAPTVKAEREGENLLLLIFDLERNEIVQGINKTL